MATVSSTSSSVPMASVEAEAEGGAEEEEGEEEVVSMVVEEPLQSRQQSSPDSSKVCVCVCVVERLPCVYLLVLCAAFSAAFSAGQWNQRIARSKCKGEQCPHITCECK